MYQRILLDFDLLHEVLIGALTSLLKGKECGEFKFYNKQTKKYYYQKKKKKRKILKGQKSYQK